ncbi:unnamed protein product [Caenorhabditis brenneri]
MTNVSFQIPLLELPERGIKRVLQQMEFYGLLSFSYISRQARNAVATLEHLHPDRIVIEISGSITINCLRKENGSLRRTTFMIFKKPCGITPDTAVLPIPALVEVFEGFANRGTSFPNSNKDFGLKQYLEHILGIFKCKDIQVFFNTPIVQIRRDRVRRDVFPVEPLYEAFENVNIGSLLIKTRLSEQLIKRFLPRTDVYEIVCDHPFSKPFFRKILIQNLTKLDVCKVPAQFALKLDDLLMTNCSHVMIKARFNEKELNTFFRCWQSGSNPRLKYVNIRFITPRQLDRAMTLKGTEFQQRTRSSNLKTVYGIQRVGGINAEINIRRDNHGISMYVID